MISCSDYDYIEIVCLFKYPVELTMKSGLIISGKALDTARNQANEECIKLQTEGTEILVVLDSVTKLKVSVNNPHFQEVTFN
ncbi:Rho-binding antiterminator [Vibrio vulnificus]|uniref:Rho-specific inhibitor of transcription termination (YaeO) n=1 Tax=Vibrio vulnificus TaxID=672 RepID=A0AAN1PNB9_VIBVL|nr:Rho-binding antiterminator [Vibrio vulnificus]ALM70669.1 Rho-specific inhibitor of transcription termination (YaeO) [Vibrio vulnificus]ANH63525.1 Rho-specific inhibitor of transcription termination (YaeO) [Vibrio vulnificus]AXX59660.1 Rho-specific inhibitor of transcription termination (YaeO) [Vibrio vulnificus]NTJ39380.1 Rho-binding antiterminator [Vibrio vulnificus]HDY7754542.1 Rho-binding antiterminator [Vibrio vulnificus]